MPGNHGLRLHDDKGVGPARPKMAKRYPEEPIEVAQFGTCLFPFEDSELLAKGEIDRQGFIKLVSSSAPSTGYCNTMGTATTMNSLAEVLGMPLRGVMDLNLQTRNTGITELQAGASRIHCVSFNNVPHLDRPDRAGTLTYS